MQKIEEGFLVFTADGQDAVGAVRAVSRNSIILYVENSGDYVIPMSAVEDVHAQKVILDRKALDGDVLSAITHAHDREDPEVQG